MKVNSLMQEMGYTPDPQARGLAFRRSFLIGLVFDNPNAQMVVTMQEGVLAGLKGSGFELVVHACDRNAADFLPEVAAFVERQKLFGVILLPPISENNARKTGVLKSCFTPARKFLITTAALVSSSA